MSGSRSKRKKARKQGDEGWLSWLGSWLKRAILDNAGLKFVALVLSVTLFILVNTSRDAVIGVNLGISYSLPKDRVLVSERPDQLHLTLRGAWRRVKRFDERELDRINVDLRSVRGSEYTFSEKAISLPDGLRLLSIEPSSISLRFEALEERANVKVTVPTSGQPAEGYEVVSITAKPSQIAVKGAESAIRELAQIATRPLDLNGKTQSFTETLLLAPPRPEPIIQIVDSSAVEVAVALREKEISRQKDEVKVLIRAGAGVEGAALDGASVEPDQVSVILHGPKGKVDTYFDNVVAFVEVLPEDLTGARETRRVSVRLEYPPEGVGIEVKPRDVELRRK